MSRHQSLLLFLVLIALFTVLAVLMPQSGHDPVRDQSMTRSNEWGTKALADLARERGLQVTAWERPMAELGQRQGLLLVLNPTYAPQEKDLQAALKWVRQGGTLLVAADVDDYGDVKADEELLQGLGLVTAYVAGKEGLAAPVGQEKILREVKQVQVGAGARLKPLPRGAVQGWQTLLADRQGAVLLRARHGKGWTYALADASVLSNRTISEGDNVILAANLLWGHGRQGVYFNEFLHQRQALREDEQPLDPSRALGAALAATAALLLFLFSRGSRFGAAVPLVTPPRRSALEFVGALAELYRRAEARGAVVGILEHAFRRRLAQLAGVSPELPPRALTASLRQLSPELQAQLAALLERLAEAAQGQPNERELLHLTKLVAHYEEALTHGH